MNLFSCETQFTVVADHKVLKYACQKPGIHGRIACWLDLFVKFHLEVKYRPVIHNGVADFLSDLFNNKYEIEKNRAR